MAVAYDASSIPVGSHSGNFSWTHTPGGTPKGILVFLSELGSASNPVTAVTYGGVAMTAVPGGVASDGAGEPCCCAAYFLGSSIPTGAQTVSVTAAGGLIVYGCAISVTALTDTETNGVVLLQDDGTLAEQNVTDGSPGTNSVRFAGGSFGKNSVVLVGANSTLVSETDDGTQVVSYVRETTAGQGSRPIGWTDPASDDRAAVHLAVREVVGVPFDPSTAPPPVGANAFSAEVDFSSMAEAIGYFSKDVLPSIPRLIYSPALATGEMINGRIFRQRFRDKHGLENARLHRQRLQLASPAGSL